MPSRGFSTYSPNSTLIAFLPRKPFCTHLTCSWFHLGLGKVHALTKGLYMCLFRLDSKGTQSECHVLGFFCIPRVWGSVCIGHLINTAETVVEQLLKPLNGTCRLNAIGIVLTDSRVSQKTNLPPEHIPWRLAWWNLMTYTLIKGLENLEHMKIPKEKLVNSKSAVNWGHVTSLALHLGPSGFPPLLCPVLYANSSFFWLFCSFSHAQNM